MKSPIFYWNKFWFKKADPLPLAVFRVLLGLNCLEIFLMHTAPNFFIFFGPDAICSQDVVASGFWFSRFIFDPFVAFHGAHLWLLFLLGVMLLANVSMILGLFTRLSMVVLFLCQFGLYNEDVFVFNGGDEFRRFMLLFLCFSPAGATFSLDSVIAGLKQDWRIGGFAPKLEPVWALRWLQLQFSFIYWNVTANKISGPEWRDGTAVYYATHVQDLQRVYIPFLFEHDITVRLLTYGTMVIEGALATLVWIRPLCYPVLFLGILFHAGIDVSMALPGFETAFVSSYILFVRPEDLYKFASWVRRIVRKIFGAPVICYYNGERQLSVKTAGVIRRLDIFRNLELNDGADICADSLIALSLKNDLYLGYKAFIILCTKLPFLFLLVPLNVIVQLSGFSTWFFKVFAKAFAGALERLSRGYHGIELLGNDSLRQRSFVGLLTALIVFGFSATAIERPSMERDIQSRNQKRLIRAERKEIDARLISLKNASADDPQVIDWKFKAAVMTYIRRRFQISELYLLSIFEHLTAKLPNYDKVYPETLQLMANLYLDAGLPERAVYFFAKVKKFDEAKKALGNATTARDLNNLAVARYLNGVTKTDEAARQREFKIAEDYSMRSLNCEITTAQRANFLDNLALIRRERGFGEDYWWFKDASNKLTSKIPGRIVPPQ